MSQHSIRVNVRIQGGVSCMRLTAGYGLRIYVLRSWVYSVAISLVVTVGIADSLLASAWRILDGMLGHPRTCTLKV